MTAIWFIILTILINFLIDRCSRKAVTRALFLPERVWLKSIYHLEIAAHFWLLWTAETRDYNGFFFNLTARSDIRSLSPFPSVSSRFYYPESGDKAWINNRLSPAFLFRSSSCFLSSLYYAASADITLHNKVSRAAVVYLQSLSSSPSLTQFFFKTCEFVVNENKWFPSYFKNPTFSDRVIKCTRKYTP